jgi:glycosyltransferase involved in cell wall biosynthesis
MNKTEPIISVVIPAHNEEASIALVVGDVPSMVNEVVVVDNASNDQTAQNAQKAGATVLKEHRMGYGHACLKGIDYLEKSTQKPDIIVFLDGDYSDYPEELSKIVDPIITGQTDLVIGARVKQLREKGSMTPQQVFGNRLATLLMRWLYGSQFTDLGPFRAIRFDTFQAMEMEDKTYGWTVEMQLKALRMKLNYTEVPVRYRNRIGHSKVSGTVKGTVMAGIKIIGWIIQYGFRK